MTNLDAATALTVIRQLNNLDGSIPNVSDEKLGAGVCLSLAAQTWLERNGGAVARWALVDVLVSALTAGGAFSGVTDRQDAATPLAMIAHLKAVASGSGRDGHESSGLRNFCGEKRSTTKADALWHVASLAVELADHEASETNHLDQNFSVALMYAGINLSAFLEVLAALTGADQRA